MPRKIIRTPYEYSGDLKILFWDLETTDFRADWGRLLCFGYKWAHEDRVRILTIEDFAGGKDKIGMLNDKELVKAVSEIICEADVIVTWYGKRFDMPFLNTRLLKHKLPTLPQHPTLKHVDGWETSRKFLKLRNNRLDSVARHVGCDVEKTWVDPEVWQAASLGDKKSLRYIYDHCEKDIVVLEEVFYEAILPLTPFMPGQGTVFSKADCCPRCGSEGTMQSRGWGYNKLSSYRRFFCTCCRGWSRGPNERAGKNEDRPDLRT